MFYVFEFYYKIWVLCIKINYCGIFKRKNSVEIVDFVFILYCCFVVGL